MPKQNKNRLSVDHQIRSMALNYAIAANGTNIIHESSTTIIELSLIFEKYIREGINKLYKNYGYLDVSNPLNIKKISRKIESSYRA